MSLANFSTEVNWRDARNESLDKFWCDIYFSVSLVSSEQFGRKNICLAEVSECFFPCTLQLNLARPFCLWETRLIAPLKHCYTWCNLLSFFIFLLAVTCQNTCARFPFPKTCFYAIVRRQLLLNLGETLLHQMLLHMWQISMKLVRQWNLQPLYCTSYLVKECVGSFTSTKFYKWFFLPAAILAFLVVFFNGNLVSNLDNTYELIWFSIPSICLPRDVPMQEDISSRSYSLDW